MIGGPISLPPTKFQGLIGHWVEIPIYGQFSFKVGNN